jgi:LmbE family N-acetylglucosaminyl deacetylase
MPENLSPAVLAHPDDGSLGVGDGLAHCAAHGRVLSHVSGGRSREADPFEGLR